MASLVYLDTSSLIRWASGIGRSPDDRDRVGKETLEALIEGPKRLYASPVTIAEFSTVTHAMFRSTQDWRLGFGEEQLDDVTRRFMKFMSNGEVTIRELGPRAFEMGMAYVASAAREHGRKMHAWDAIHLYEACRLSRDQDGEKVMIATSDGDFDGFLAVFPEFNEHVELLDTTTSDR